jgi:glycosyltransferase involved in cell wall biosynthesis
MIARVAATVMAISQAAEPGGAERALLRVARHLPEHGFELVLTVPSRGGVEDEAREAGIPVRRLAVGGLERGRWPRAVVSWPRARALARRLAPDLVYLNGAVTQRVAPVLLDRTLVLHLHDLAEARSRLWRSRRFWDAVPVVLCASRAVAEAAAAVGAPADRLRTVYCPVESVTPAERPSWSADGPVIGYVGRIEPRKGTLDLLRAAQSVFERRPDARVVVVGGDDYDTDPGYRAQVEHAARELGPRVLLLGRVPDANRLMPWFDVLAVPSLREPFGTVAAEALAAGTPVAATASGGIPGRSGALVPPGDPLALAEALVSLLDRGPELRDAARAAAAPFATERVAAAVARQLSAALAARGSRSR